MTRKDESTRRSSVEERRVFRTAHIEYVQIGRVTRMDAAAADLLHRVDLAPPRILNVHDWSRMGLEALMLCHLPVVVGSAHGTREMGWLANPALLLAAQQHWPSDTLIPVVVLAHQVAERTRKLVAGGGLFAASAPALAQPTSPSGLHRVWTAMIEAGLNPLATTSKMNLVRAAGCDPRKLPGVRSVKKSEGGAE